MINKRDYKVNYSRYSFKAEDDFGDYSFYFNGKYRKGWFDEDGYCHHSYYCTDGNFHGMDEHIAKWEYFNGEIPEGYEIDHIIPLRNGGTNKLSNLRIVTHADNMNNEYTLINCSISHKGHQDTDDTRKKKSASHKGSKNVNYKKYNQKYQSRKVYQYNIEGELVAIWPSLRECERNGFEHSSVSRCCNGKIKSYKGYIWSFEPLN